jgi:hypothetical protein
LNRAGRRTLPMLAALRDVLSRHITDNYKPCLQCLLKNRHSQTAARLPA